MDKPAPTIECLQVQIIPAFAIPQIVAAIFIGREGCWSDGKTRIIIIDDARKTTKQGKSICNYLTTHSSWKPIYYILLYINTGKIRL